MQRSHRPNHESYLPEYTTYCTAPSDNRTSAVNATRGVCSDGPSALVHCISAADQECHVDTEQGDDYGEEEGEEDNLDVDSGYQSDNVFDRNIRPALVRRERWEKCSREDSGPGSDLVVRDSTPSTASPKLVRESVLRREVVETRSRSSHSHPQTHSRHPDRDLRSSQSFLLTASVSKTARTSSLPPPSLGLLNGMPPHSTRTTRPPPPHSQTELHPLHTPTAAIPIRRHLLPRQNSTLLHPSTPTDETMPRTSPPRTVLCVPPRRVCSSPPKLEDMGWQRDGEQRGHGGRGSWDGDEYEYEEEKEEEEEGEGERRDQSDSSKKSIDVLDVCEDTSHTTATGNTRPGRETEEVKRDDSKMEAQNDKNERGDQVKKGSKSKSTMARLKKFVGLR